MKLLEQYPARVDLYQSGDRHCRDEYAKNLRLFADELEVIG